MCCSTSAGRCHVRSVNTVCGSFWRALESAWALPPHPFSLLTQHREEPVERCLHAGTVAAGKPANQRGEVEHTTTAELPGIGDVVCAQFLRIEVGNELAQNRDYRSSYHRVVARPGDL